MTTEKTTWKLSYNDDRTVEAIDLGLCDAKGRRIGYLVSRSTAVVVEGPWEGYTQAGALERRGLAVGALVHVGRVSATRDGNGFGACQDQILAASAAGREATIAHKLAGGRARYAKQFAKG